MVALLNPPTSSVSRSIISDGMFFVLLNMMCSKRCANPLRPSGSSFEPTRYQTCTATVGVERSWTE